MGKTFVGQCVLAALALVCHGLLIEASGFLIRNKLLGKCLQVQVGQTGGRVSMVECVLNSPLQEWGWHPHSQALMNHHTRECLTAPGEQYEGVHLQPCIQTSEGQVASPGEVEKVEGENENRNQEWSCSRKGHLTLLGKGVHLSATKDSTLVFLSKEHKQQGSRWQTLDNQTVCSERHNSHHHMHRPGEILQHVVAPISISSTQGQPQQIGGLLDLDDYQVPSTKSPVDPTMVFFTLDYGMSWKITMLVLSSLALVLGTLILILNVYTSRRKKVVCVLKSYTPREEVSLPGSPVPNERAPLTRHAMSLPHSSPSLRGEILIEWKDGTVTPLYEG